MLFIKHFYLSMSLPLDCLVPCMIVLTVLTIPHPPPLLCLVGIPLPFHWLWRGRGVNWLGETTVSRISFLVYLVTMGNKKYCCRRAEDYSFVAYTHCPSYSFKHESRLFCEGLVLDVIKSL